MTTESTLTQDATQAASAAQPAQQPTTDGANSGSSNGAKFTQEQVNEMVGKTRKEARETAIADLLKELGLTSKEDVKSTIEDARKRKEADMTEADKAKAELERERKAKTDLEQRIATMETERRNDKIASALTRAAQAMKANDAEDVLLYARAKHGEAVNALIDDTGAVNEKAVTALLEKIKAEKGHYFTPPASIPGSRSNNEGRVIPSEAEAMKRFSMKNQSVIRGR